MDTPTSDEQIRDAILSVLHKAHRNPKGKYRNVTFSVLERDVRDLVTCEREGVLREVRYLIQKKMVREYKERHAAYKIYDTKFPASSTTCYALTSQAIDLLEAPGKYANIGFMMTRHTVRILKASDNFNTSHEYRGDFQPRICFLPIDANVNENDKIQLIIDGEVKDEKVVGKVNKYFGSALEHIEIDWKKDQEGTMPTYQVNIHDSQVSAPITQGTDNYVVSFNPESDVEKILQLVQSREGLDDNTKSELTSVIKSELPTLLKEADSVKTKSFLEKIKGYGQTWLVPVIAQVAATYIQHSLGINQ